MKNEIPDRSRVDSDALRLARLRLGAASRTVLLFLVFGLLWIVVTTLAGDVIFEDPESLAIFELIKGVLFVVLSAVIIYLSIASHAERVLHSEIRSIEKLKQSEQTFQTLVNGIGDHLIILLRPDGRIRTWNPGAESITGYAASEVIGKHYEVLFTEHERREGLPESRLSDGREGKSITSVSEMVRGNGEKYWLEWTLSAIRNNEGELVCFAKIGRDLTEKKTAEERVIRSEQFVRAVLDSFPFQTAVIDREGIIVMVNTTWEAFALSNGAKDLESTGVGASYFDVCPVDVRDQLLQVARGGRAISIEYPCHSPERERWFLMKAAPLGSQDGGAVLTHVDITDRVIAEQALERREREYRTIIETMGEGLFTLDAGTSITYANRQFCELVGYDLSELLGQDVIGLLAFDEDRGHIEEMSKRRLQGLSDRYESRMKHKTGKEVLIHMNAVPRFDSDGRIIGKLCVANDVTQSTLARREQERLRMQIDEMNRIESLGKLAGTMAHEFNNVLMGIQPFADVIKRSVDEENERVRNATTFIVDAVNRGRRISQEVLRFARPQPPVRKRIATQVLLKDVEEIARSILGGKLALAVESPTNREITIDREQIIQVFSNLTINSRDASAKGGKLTIRASVDSQNAEYEFGVVEHPDEFVHFTISDEGSGIPKEMLVTIFEPMVTTKRNGTGLGLAITHQIVTAHGGKIFVESMIGEGTTFHLFLPLADVPITDRNAIETAGS